MQLDPTQFLHHLESFEMSEAQKIDYVRAIILVMQSFVDRAFGDAPEQILLGTSANNGINRDSISLESLEGVTSPFNHTAGEKAVEHESHE